MLKDVVNQFEKIYLATGYTDYPRRIIIREVFGEAPQFLILLVIFLNNDIADILIV